MRKIVTLDNDRWDWIYFRYFSKFGYKKQIFDLMITANNQDIRLTDYLYFPVGISINIPDENDIENLQITDTPTQNPLI